jgi:hypothetical protein
MSQQTLFGEQPKEEEPKKREYKPKVVMHDPDEPVSVGIGVKARYGWGQLPDD